MKDSLCSSLLKPLLASLVLAAATLLAGCASTGGQVTTLYDFGPPPLTTAPATATATAPAATPALAALVLTDVTGPAWLDGQRMYYRLLYADPQQSRPYAYNQWNGTPLQLLTARLKSRMALAGVKVLAATDASTGVPLLRIEVDDFSQNFDTQTQSSGQIALRVSLLRGHQLVDQKSFQRATPARSADALGGAQALAASTDALAGDILAWLATQPKDLPAR